jgi:murein DD-endopeptidase MepM/ murein hydrolase activator NlpD
VPDQTRPKHWLAKQTGMGGTRAGSPVAGFFNTLIVDLGDDIGAPHWWRGLATLLTLSASALALAQLSPLRPLMTDAPYAATPAQAYEITPTVIAPLSQGATMGWHAKPTALAVPLKEAPEKPRVERVLKLTGADSLEQVMRQAGIGLDDARTALAEIKKIAAAKSVFAKGAGYVVLGRRETKKQPRPLEQFTYRASFEDWVEVRRSGASLVARMIPIKIDATPLRIVSVAGSAISRSARASGAPADVANEFVKQMSYAVDFERDLDSADRFEMLFEHEVAETGDVRTGKLLHAVLHSSEKNETVELTRFAPAGETAQFFTPDGVTVKRLLIKTPVDGARQTSGFGWRLHPILGYSRLHQGIDFAAPSGTPVMAAGFGTVEFAGRHGGHGNYIKLKHQGGYETAYGHLSAYASGLRVGNRINQGQIIGYVGSTGLSTGPHLHYEIYADGKVVNPAGAKLPIGRWLEGDAKQKFLAQLAKMRAVKAARKAEFADAKPATKNG